MGKNKKNKTNESGKQAGHTGRQPSGKKTKKDAQRKKVNEEDHLNHIPSKLREIMRSKEKQKRPEKKRKLQQDKPESPNDGDIAVPRFKRRKQESEKAYLQRMDNAAKHVLFLTKNQVERKPELDADQQERPAKSKSDRKREHDKDRLLKLQLKKLDKKEARMEKDMFVDSVAFGEVAMAPPALSAKPKKAPVKPQKAAKELLLNSLLGHTAISTAKPSMAKQRIMEEERERAVEAYRQLKKQKQLHREVRMAGLGKVKNIH